MTPALIKRVESARGPEDDDVRIVDCECCDGSGWWEMTPLPQPYHIPHRPLLRCNWCGGSGKTTVFLKPITMEDLSDER